MTEEELMYGYRNAPRDPGRLPDAEVDWSSGGFTRREATFGNEAIWDGTVPHSRVSGPSSRVLGPIGVQIPFEVIE
jgi:hypothetical protein